DGDAAGVVAVAVRQDDVLDWPGVFGLEQLLVARGGLRQRGVDDDVAVLRGDQEGVAEADRLVDRLVDLQSLLLVLAPAEHSGRVVEERFLQRFLGRLLRVGIGRRGLPRLPRNAAG